MTTPMMVQWKACKEQAKNALVLFRLGDFYEAFEEDASILSKELDVVLTQRQETPMAGIPAHSAEVYIDRLLSKGYRIAVAEQMEEAAPGKGLVRREIVRFLTPGSVIQSHLLQDKTSNFMASVVRVGSVFGVAVLDVTTADFRVMEFLDVKQVVDELARLNPQEIISTEKTWADLAPELSDLKVASHQLYDEWYFDGITALERLCLQLGVKSLDAFGLQGMHAAIKAAGGLLAYATQDLHLKLPHLRSIRAVHPQNYLWIDKTTQKHLELLEPLHENGVSLLSILDTTLTPMGGRLLKEWLLHPLLSPPDIHKRHDAVEKYVKDGPLRHALRDALQPVRDLERLIMRIEAGYTTPKDFVALRMSLKPLPNISSLLKDHPLDDLTAVEQKIAKALTDDPPIKLSDGNVIRAHYHAPLDELRALKNDSQQWLASYQTELRQTLQIKTLKVGYTQAFGYYIEISRGQSDRMPVSFQKRQTLVNSERFISPELKEFEHKIYSAEEKIRFLEQKLFEELRQEIAQFAPVIRRVAQRLARLDVILSFADVAKKRSYIRPIMDEGDRLYISEGRHPVIEASLSSQSFIPNDLSLNLNTEQLIVLTGPNMAGKSTFIRQAALITLMGQIGCFVPAREAHIGVVDQILTRIGASDNLSKGQSTFMVEMIETAKILRHTTSKSLVILDEIGRGTSTYDGIAIAWAVAEYLLKTEGKKAKTLFATHYFELTALEKYFPQAVNYHVKVEENEEGIIFLHRIAKGSADKSYGIHVAKIAGMPHEVIDRAGEILTKLNKTRSSKAPSITKELQLELF